MTLSTSALYIWCHYAEYHNLFIVMLNVIMLSVVMVNIVVPYCLGWGLNLESFYFSFSFTAQLPLG